MSVIYSDLSNGFKTTSLASKQEHHSLNEGTTRVKNWLDHPAQKVIANGYYSAWEVQLLSDLYWHWFVSLPVTWRRRCPSILWFLRDWELGQWDPVNFIKEKYKVQALGRMVVHQHRLWSAAQQLWKGGGNLLDSRVYQSYQSSWQK